MDKVREIAILGLLHIWNLIRIRRRFLFCTG